MAETDLHRDLMIALIQILQAYYAPEPMVYVSGNLLVFYIPGDKRRHLSPDVFVVKGVAKRRRLNYLVWQEGKAPDLVIEITSSSTKAEDLKHKFQLYQNVLRVSEYFLFDPTEDYLDPPLQGYRLKRGVYVPITAREGRLPSKVLGLHLERHETELRLYDPSTGRWLPTPAEQLEQVETARQREQKARQREQKARQQAEAENERLRRELDALRQRRPEPE
jgi:Uma2 family endonuclease